MNEKTNPDEFMELSQHTRNAKLYVTINIKHGQGDDVREMAEEGK